MSKLMSAQAVFGNCFRVTREWLVNLSADNLRLGASEVRINDSHATENSWNSTSFARCDVSYRKPIWVASSKVKFIKFIKPKLVTNCWP